MALGDVVVLCRQRSMDSMGGGHIGPTSSRMADDLSRRNQQDAGAHHLAHQHHDDERRCGAAAAIDNNPATTAGVSFLSNTSYLCDLRHDADEAAVPAAEPGAVSRWRMKDRVR